MSPPIRILHLEDSPLDAELIHAMLEAEGVVADITLTPTRQSYAAALASGPFDLILSDNNLPGFDGATALEWAREKQPETPVVMISGSLGEDEAVKCLQRGATDYLLKARLERLGPAIKRALAEAQERRRLGEAEADLRRSEERMRLALAATNDGIWDWDLTAGRMVCNETFDRLFGGTAGDDDPRSWWTSHLHPDERDEVQRTLEAAIAAGDPLWRRNHRLRRPDGQWAHVHNRVCLAKNTDGIVARVIGAVQDITATMQAEAERRRLEEQLRQAQKMEAIGTLAGGIAHDFNNILGIIMANTEVAQYELPPEIPEEHETRESLREINLATNRARDLVQQILTFSRRTETRRGPIRIQPVAAECVKLLRSTIPAMVTIADRIDASCAPILGDATQIHQIIVNLCTNSWHALPERGGTIELRVEEHELPPQLLESHRELVPGRYVRITIADNGHGMDAATQARIFEPFFTTKAQGKGTGLGLAVVHGIVQSHDGAITLESAPGVGTRFDIYLPRHGGEEAPASRPSAAAATPGAGQRILFVDDEPAIGRAMRRFLEKLNYRVDLLHHPGDALETLRADPNGYDVVITDFSMPEMSGIELARQVRRIRADLPLVLVTGSAGFDERIQARADGLCDLLHKPVAPETLAHAVARILEPSHRKTPT